MAGCFVDAPMSYYVPEKRDTNREGFGVQPNGATRAGFGVAPTRSEKMQRPEVRRALGDSGCKTTMTSAVNSMLNLGCPKLGIIFCTAAAGIIR